MMEEDKVVEIVSESHESEIDSTERKPRRRERGPDKKPRTYRANSMNNFVQFKDRPEEFEKYLKDVKGVDITGNSGIVKAFLIFCVAMIAVFGGLWLYNHYKKVNDDSTENR
ncbi:MAG: hypothetical protein OEM28_09455 [Nitrosopumilus sp.]|nr:hypothetical protein [Nitrosopumilus sp.]MDH3488508.1 hypothetical protein [Nitrosopumilus sp.]